MKLPARQELLNTIYGILLEVAATSVLILFGLLICLIAAGVGEK